MKTIFKKAVLGFVLTVLAHGATAQTWYYHTGFENDDDTIGWVLLNGNEPNRWYIGTAEHSEGAYALYVSSNGGVSSRYHIDSASLVYAYYEFTVSSPTICELSFDWKSLGYYNYDFFRVFLIPATDTLLPGVLPSNCAYSGMFSSYPVPGWIDMSGGRHAFSQRTVWQHHFASDSVPAGVWRLAFVWSNSPNRVGGGVPACIDNIVLVQTPCPTPARLTINNILPESCDIQWDGRGASQWIVEYADHPFSPGCGQGTRVIVYDTSYIINGLSPLTNYYVYVRADCSGDTSFYINGAFSTPCRPLQVADLPFIERFDTYTANTIADIDSTCWDFYRRTSSGGIVRGGGYAMVADVYFRSGRNSLRLMSNPEDYAVLPMLEMPADGLDLYFSARGGGVSVVVMIDPLVDSTYHTVASFCQSSYSDYYVWKDYKVTIPSTMGRCHYVALSNASVNNYGCMDRGPYDVYIDDIMLSPHSSCDRPRELHLVGMSTVDSTTIEWTGNDVDVHSWDVLLVPAGSNPDTSSNIITVYDSIYTFTGLPPTTDYEAYVRSSCDSGGTSAWLGPLRFVTNRYMMQMNGIDTIDACIVDIVSNTAANRSATGSVSTVMVRCAAGSLFNITSNRCVIGSIRDSMYIYDGSGPTARLLAQAGIRIDSIGPLVSTSNMVTLVFKRRDTIGATYSLNIALRCFDVPDCYVPVRLDAVPLIDSCLLEWQEFGTSTSWGIEYGPCGFVPGTGTRLTSAYTNYMLTGLAPGTCYDCYVWSNCSAGGTSDTAFISFSTLTRRPVYNYPYICTFANSREALQWERIDTLQDSKWYVGQAAHNGNADNYGLYISSNQGVDNTYCNAASCTTSSCSYAFRALYLRPGNYTYRYDWRCLGQQDYDYLRVAIVPCTLSLAVDSIAIFTNNSVPMGCIAIDGGRQLSVSPSWATARGTFTVVSEGVYKILFVWQNNEYLYVNPPAAVDNVMIYPTTCPAVASVAVTQITPSSATVTWTPVGTESQWAVDLGGTTQITQSPTINLVGLTDSTTYTCRVRPVCGAGDTGLAATATFTTRHGVPCAEPTGLGSINLTTTSTKLSWRGADSVELSYKPATFADWSPTIFVNATTYILTGLQPGTRYQWSVRRLCGAGSVSPWAVSEFTSAYEGGDTTVIVEPEGMLISIYPNPAEADGGVTVEVRGVEGPVTVAVVDIAGRTLRQEALTCGGDCTAHVEFADLPRGAYFVKVQTAERTAIEKVIIR